MTTAQPHRDVLTIVGDIIFAISAVVAGIIIARIALVQADAGLHGGVGEWFRHAGFVLTTPFHGLLDLKKWKSQELVNDSIAVGVYLGLGWLARRLLR